MGRRGACLRNDAAIAHHRGLFAAANVPQRTGATRVERKFAGTATGAVRRWFKRLVLIGSGTLFLPIAALGGRPAIMRSLVLAARGSGRIAAEFGIVYEEYR